MIQIHFIQFIGNMDTLGSKDKLEGLYFISIRFLTQVSVVFIILLKYNVNIYVQLYTVLLIKILTTQS